MERRPRDRIFWRMLIAVSLLFATINVAYSQQLIDEYSAFIGQEDLYNSRGVRLTKPWQIVRQDRANYHRYGIRQSGDQDDAFFGVIENRGAMERMVKSGTIEPSAAEAIVNGDVHIMVRVFGNAGIGIYIHVGVGDALQMDNAIRRGDRRIPIIIGGDADYDACGGTGEVNGLNPRGDNFLSVRSGPGSRYNEVDRIKPGQNVFLCDEAGNWFGIVYGKYDCGVMSPVATRQPYKGDCKSGWVSKKFVAITSG